jgi:hypothetical protein
MANTITKLTANGNYYIAGTLDETTYNKINPRIVNILSWSSNLANTTVWPTYPTYTNGDLAPTPTANTTAPDGTYTAYKLVAPNGAGPYYWNIIQFSSNWSTKVNINPGQTAIISCYVKLAESTFFNFGLQFYDTIGASEGATVNLLTQAIAPNGSQDLTINVPTLTTVGNGWYRFSIARKAQGIINGFYIYSYGNSASFIGDGVSGAYVWGPQMEIVNTGTTAPSPYVATGAFGVPVNTSVTKLDSIGNFYTSGNYDEYTRGGNLVTNGLIYYMDPAKPESWNGNTSIYDVTGTQASGSLVGGYTYSTNGGGSIRFDGASTGGTSSGTGYANTGINANSSIFQTNSNYTLSVWCRFEKNTTYHDANPALGGIFSWMYFAGYGIMWISDANGNITNSAGASVYATVRTNGSNETFSSYYVNLILNQWYNFVMVYNSSGVYTLYVNGSAYGSNGNAIQGYYGNTNNTTLGLGRADIEGGGQSFADRQTFPGSIGQALIYNRALSAAEVLQNYNEMLPQYRI